ncbi:MAG TPA: riboflavin synthase [Abditibacteriaceae bacterium]|jgi:riboflavin synthase
MFTGLVECLGTIESIENVGEARRFSVGVEHDDYLIDAVLGESISVNGTCLTAVELQARRFVIEAVEETMRRTTLGDRQVGDRVNLERALKASARLGGHIVQGHVDGVGTIMSTRSEGEGWWVTVEPPFALMKYIVEKGSICIDGVSLTVANAAYRRFSVALIPHTRDVTTAGDWNEGRHVNLEVDVIAKYVERLTQWTAQHPSGYPVIEI